MTTVYLLLSLGFVLHAGSIVHTVAREMRSERETREVALWEEFVAEPTADWPTRLTRSDLPGIGHTAELAAVQLASRLFAPAPVPIVVGLPVLGGRHHIGVAPGTDAQRARWNSPTGQFWAIVAGLGDLEQPCSHCAAPEDGEPAHVGCPGCCCPCTLVGAA